MSEKKLWQVGWKGGQTEGDVGPETVQELLNVDLDVEGQLHPRGTLTENTSRLWTHTGATDIPIDMKYMNKPDDAAVVYRVQLTTTGITVLLDSDGSTVVTLTFAAAEGWAGSSTIDITSKMDIDNNNIYVTALISGVPVGVFKAMYISGSTRWRIPLGTSNTGLSAEAAYSAKWVMIGPDGIVPALDIIEITETWGQAPSNTRDAFYSSANTLCGLMKTKVVIGALKMLDRAQSTAAVAAFIPQMSAKQTFTVEFSVQFVYVDGTHSSMSDPASFTSQTSAADLAVGIASTIAMNTSLSQAVAAVNVYRRIIRKSEATITDPAYELLYTADIGSDVLAEKDSISSENVIHKYWAEFHNLGSGVGTDDEAAMGTTSMMRVTIPSTTTNLIEPGAGHRREFSGTATYTSGWFKVAAYTPDTPDSNLVVFCPRALIASGIHTYYAGNMIESQNEATQGQYYKMVLGSVGNECVSVYNFAANLGSNVYAIGGDQSILSPRLVLGSYAQVPVRYYMGAAFTDNGGTWSVTEKVQTASFGDDIGGIVMYQPTNSVTKCNYSTTAVTGAGTRMIDPKVLVMYVDDTQAGFSVENVAGINDIEKSVVLPRKISFGAGRMLCLNVRQDETEKAARLVYSEFRRYNAFRKSNYIDYGPRDDGVGVSIAYFAGRLLVLHSTSCYVIDISGGSDMAWRELASYKDVGAISDKAVVTSSVGVFFASQADVYFFDGNKIIKISDLEGRRVTAAYQAMTKANITLLWRSDLHQLWVCDRGTTVLVFDMDLGAWHKHSLIEFSTAGPYMLPIRFNNLANAEFLTTAYKNGTTDKVQAYTFVTNGTTTPFQWGVTTGPINMGVSEVVKKAKSLYVDTSGVASTSGDIDVWYTDVTGSADKSFTPGTSRAVNRVKVSSRNYWLNMKLLTKLNGSTYWRGAIESLGLSYRPKRLK
jgi:hypothetical protein